MQIDNGFVEIEGVRYELASVGLRFVGQFLDGVVYVALIFASILGGMLVGAVVGTMVIGAILMPIGVIVALLYLFFQDGLGEGQSYGKKWIHTRVIDSRTGEPCTFGQSFIRNLLLLVLGVIDWVFIVGESRRRLGDRAANTVVVKASS